MLEVALHRVALHVAGLGEVDVAAVGHVQHHPRLAQREVHLVLADRDVHEFHVIAVDDGRHVAGSPQPTGGTLAEVRTGLGGDLDVGHGGAPSAAAR